MKAYKSYMDKITLDTKQYDKIMSKVNKMPAPPHSSKMVKLTKITACAAALLLIAWMLPGILSNKVDYDENNNLASIVATTEPYFAYSTTMPQTTQPVLHALVFNEAMGSAYVASRTRLPDGYFDFDLTDEQLNILFPNFETLLSTRKHNNNAFAAVVAYRADGTLRHVTVMEITDSAHMSLHVGREGANSISMPMPYVAEPVVSYVHGIPVMVLINVFTHADGRETVSISADFTIQLLPYSIVLTGYPPTEGQERMTKIVNHLITNGPADLSILYNPVIPELRDEELTLHEAQNCPLFGRFVPNTPDEFVFVRANRVITTRSNHLTVSFMHDVPWQFRNTIMWTAAVPTEDDFQRIVCTTDTHKFDVALFPFPWADSVPHEYRNYFHNAVFIASEITLQTVQARTWWDDRERGNIPGWRLNDFSVLFDDVIVHISLHGLSAEQIWEMIEEIK